LNHPEQSVSWRRNGVRDLLAGYDDPADFDDLPSATDPSAGLISLGFIGSALRRGVLLWLTLTVVGLVLGAGLALDHVPAYTATTTVLLDTSGGTQGGALDTDAAIAESTPVAAAVVKQLGIQQTPVNFLQTYTVTAGTTTQILTITAKGPNSDAAMQRASAVATQFLAFLDEYLQTQLQQTIDSLNQQVSQAQQYLDSIERQISRVSAEPTSASQTAELGGLQQQETQAANSLDSVKTNASSSQVQAETTTDQMVRGSEVLSPATPDKRSVKKMLVEYAGGGMFGGLAIGMTIVALGAITTDRLRRRDDIAIAVGAPVRLSVGRLHGRRWIPDLPQRSGQVNRDMQRVVEYLRNSVPENSKGPVGLAVIAVDDAPTVARAVIKLAIASSQQHKRVVLADLCADAPAARQLGVTRPGIETVNLEGVRIVVVVPEADDIAPVGPIRNSAQESAQVSQQLAEIGARADLVLSVVTLDPAVGGDYLRTWATDAVAVVTAGRSTATRLHAAGEMIRLPGIRLGSVVALDADRRDESLGTVIADYRPPSFAGE
jgi:capsular polysaccharide biosynthesis protein